MTDGEPNPQKLRSIKLDLEKRYLQFESTDATAIRLSLTAEGIRWELLQPPTITTARAVDRLVDAAEEEAPSEGKARFRTRGSDLTVGGRSGQERALVRQTERPNPSCAPGRSRWLVGMVARPSSGWRG